VRYLATFPRKRYTEPQQEYTLFSALGAITHENTLFFSPIDPGFWPISVFLTKRYDRITSASLASALGAQSKSEECRRKTLFHRLSNSLQSAEASMLYLFVRKTLIGLSLVLSDKPLLYTGRGAMLLLPSPGQQWLACLQENIPSIVMPISHGRIVVYLSNGSLYRRGTRALKRRVRKAAQAESMTCWRHGPVCPPSGVRTMLSRTTPNLPGRAKKRLILSPVFDHHSEYHVDHRKGATFPHEIN